MWDLQRTCIKYLDGFCEHLKSHCCLDINKSEPNCAEEDIKTDNETSDYQATTDVTPTVLDSSVNDRSSTTTPLQFVCDICERNFTTKSNLNQHRIVHSGKLFTCTECDYSCSTKYRFKQHLCVHSGEKPFSCEVCNRGFIRKSTLTEHLKVHSGERPYSCTVCDYRCKRKGDLNKHLLIHSAG